MIHNSTLIIQSHGPDMDSYIAELPIILACIYQHSQYHKHLYMGKIRGWCGITMCVDWSSVFSTTAGK